jgi:hypothetical protein
MPLFVDIDIFELQLTSSKIRRDNLGLNNWWIELSKYLTSALRGQYNEMPEDSNHALRILTKL